MSRLTAARLAAAAYVVAVVLLASETVSPALPAVVMFVALPAFVWGIGGFDEVSDV